VKPSARGGGFPGSDILTGEGSGVKSWFNHVQFNIDAANVGFYQGLFGFLGWKTIYEDGESIGVNAGGEGSLWFMAGANDAVNDHDGPGLNHLGIAAEKQSDVDDTVAFLRERGVELLYGTPCHRPEYAESEAHTYYSSMFETPDKILLEVVYMGPKQAA
jgi:catechol 2,3-dioxygenase-like lactoylglutathione lyase family enzyme